MFFKKTKFKQQRLHTVTAWLGSGRGQPSIRSNGFPFLKLELKRLKGYYLGWGSKYSFTDKMLLREIMAVMVVVNIPYGKAQRLDLIEEVIQRDMLHKPRGNLMSIIHSFILGLGLWGGGATYSTISVLPSTTQSRPGPGTHIRHCGSSNKATQKKKPEKLGVLMKKTNKVQNKSVLREVGREE